MAFRRTKVSNVLSPGNMTKRVQFQSLSYSDTEGEPTAVYTNLFVCYAEKIPHGSKEVLFAGGSDVVKSLVFWKVPYYALFRSVSQNFESIRMAEIIGSPTLLAGPTLDAFGNSLVDLDNSTVDYYNIFGFEELGNHQGYKLTTNLVR